MKLFIFSFFCVCAFAPNNNETQDMPIGRVAPGLRWAINVKSADLDRVCEWFLTAHIQGIDLRAKFECGSKLERIDQYYNLPANKISVLQALNDFGYVFYRFFLGCESALAYFVQGISDEKLLFEKEQQYGVHYQEVLHPVYLYLSQKLTKLIQQLDTFNAKLEHQDLIKRIVQESTGIAYDHLVGKAAPGTILGFLWSRDDLGNLFCSDFGLKTNWSGLQLCICAGANLLGNSQGHFNFLFLNHQLVFNSCYILSKQHTDQFWLGSNKRVFSASNLTHVSFYGGQESNFRSFKNTKSFNFPFAWEKECNAVYRNDNKLFNCLELPKTKTGHFSFIGFLLQELKKIVIETGENSFVQTFIDDILQTPSANLIKEEKCVEEVSDDEIALSNRARKNNNYVDRFSQEVAKSVAMKRENLKNQRVQAEIEFYEKWQAQVRAEQEKISAAVAGNRVDEIHSAQTSARQNHVLQTNYSQSAHPVNASNMPPEHSSSKNKPNLNDDDCADDSSTALDEKLKKLLENLPTAGRVKYNNITSVTISIINAAQAAGITVESFQDGSHIRRVFTNPKTCKKVTILDCALHGGKTLHANELNNRVFEWVGALASIM